MSSSILKWPEPEAVLGALDGWVADITAHRGDILGIGYLGSYARGDWGVGSDLDVVIIVRSSTRPFGVRSAEFDTSGLPVPVDLLVYTGGEWQKLCDQRMWQRARREIVWVYGGEQGDGGGVNSER